MNFVEYYLKEDQEFSSAKTSIPQVAELHKRLFNSGVYQDGQIILDWGGGAFNRAKDFVESQKDVKFLIYDPFNRDESHNKESLNIVSQHGGADIITLANVLNVIKEREIRISVLKDLKKYLKGKLYISVYSAARNKDYKETEDWVGQPTIKGWQNAQPIVFYIPEVKEVFSNVIKKGDILVAE